MIMNTKLTYHFCKTIKVIQSCKTEDQLLSAKLMIVNFASYWHYQKLDAKILSNYIKYLNMLIKYKRNSYE